MPKTTIGYFKVTDIYASESTPYIQCNGGTCQKAYVPNTEVTKCSSIGDLVLNESKVKLCVESSLMGEFVEDQKAKYYIIDTSNNNIFASASQDSYILVTASKNSIVPTKPEESK